MGHEIERARQLADFVAGGGSEGHRRATLSHLLSDTRKTPQRFCDTQGEQVGAERACADDEGGEDNNISDHRCEFVLLVCVGQSYLDDTRDECRLRPG